MRKKFAGLQRRGVTGLTRDASIREAARLMVNNKIGCLPVVDGESLVGLVSETDILRFSAEGG